MAREIIALKLRKNFEIFAWKINFCPIFQFLEQWTINYTLIETKCLWVSAFWFGGFWGQEYPQSGWWDSWLTYRCWSLEMNGLKSLIFSRAYAGQIPFSSMFPHFRKLLDESIIKLSFLSLCHYEVALFVKYNLYQIRWAYPASKSFLVSILHLVFYQYQGKSSGIFSGKSY